MPRLSGRRVLPGVAVGSAVGGKIRLEFMARRCSLGCSGWDACEVRQRRETSSVVVSVALVAWYVVGRWSVCLGTDGGGVSVVVSLGLVEGWVRPVVPSAIVDLVLLLMGCRS